MTEASVLSVITTLPERQSFEECPNSAKVFAVEWGALNDHPATTDARLFDVAQAFEAGYLFALRANGLLGG